ncbi:MAG TPA: GAF domain-containing sensor histidine kinase [bacterium]|jgi:signal transduction histidine kinase
MESEAALTPTRQMAVFRTIAEILNRSFTLREALDGALHRIVDLMDVRAGWIFLYDAEATSFRLAADVNLPAALAVAGKRRMAGDCRCNQMLREGQLTEAINLIQCLRLEQALPQQPESHRHATVPLIAQDEAVGILNLLLERGRTFTTEELDMLESLGHELAVTIQRARLFEKVRDQEQTARDLMQRLLVAQEEERGRIARDFHDQGGQLMSALMIQLDHLATQVDPKDAALGASLRKLYGLAQQGLEELRKLVYELRPPTLDELGLAPAIRAYVDTHVRPAGLLVDLQLNDLASRQPPEIETAAFRIVQESITNVLRHAKAKKVEVRVNRRGDALVVMVRDDGGGFEADEPQAGRRTLGLAGMRERAQLVGGSLQILSAPGIGTTVLARLPLHEDDARS